MNVKNLFTAGFAGFVVDFLLGWLLWGIVFKDMFPQGAENMLFITLGCLAFALTLSYVNGQNSNLKTGAKTGGIMALLMSLYSNFFANGMVLEPCLKTMALDVLLTVFCGILVGTTIAFVNGKLK